MVWLFVTLGMGAAVGFLVYAMVRQRSSSAEFLAIVIGAVALGAGMAGYVFLSPIVICFFAGVVLANFPLEGRARLAALITALERRGIGLGPRRPHHEHHHRHNTHRHNRDRHHHLRSAPLPPSPAS